MSVNQPGEYDNFGSLGYDFSFRDVCNKHDRCYYTLGTIAIQCNDEFTRGLFQVCYDGALQRLRPQDILTGGASRAAAIDNCLRRAEWMSQIVVTAGLPFPENYYQKAQSKQRRYLSKVEEFITGERRQAVIQIYKEILEREVDPSGLDTWTRELNSGSTVVQVRRAIAESPEAQNRLNDLYQRMLGRDIDSSGRVTWTDALASGWTLQRVASEGIAPSPEYQNRQAVIQIYREILERDVDPSGMDTWTRELNSGSTVVQVRRAIAESPEAQNKLNDLYRRMLCRDIDSSGRATWTNALASGWTLQRVAAEGIAPSPEYQSRGGRSCN